MSMQDTYCRYVLFMSGCSRLLDQKGKEKKLDDFAAEKSWHDGMDRIGLANV